MATLLLRLCGPLQSWGVESRFHYRDTASEPTKSGVLGLLCAAIGIDRDDWSRLEPMTRWSMGVRILRPGVVRTDFQTAQLHPGNPKTETTISRKAYLADADFLVGFESDDLQGLQLAHEALGNPHWVLSLGRKAFAPSLPVYLPDGLSSLALRPALVSYPVDVEKVELTLGLVLENVAGEHSERWDQPTGPFAQRLYGPRRVQFVQASESEVQEYLCISAV